MTEVESMDASQRDPFGLHGRVSVVTGGGSGIGRAICLALATAGSDVAVLDLHDGNAATVAAEVEALGRRAVPVQLDVVDIDKVFAAVATVEAALGAVDVLCNNAGVAQPQGLFVVSDPAAWSLEIDVILRGTLNCSRAFLPGMVGRKAGRVINVSSDAGRTGEAFGVVYSGAKAAVIGVTKALAKEVGRSNVTVNCVCPGATFQGSNLAARAGFTLTPEVEAKIVRNYPLGRLGRPEDQAHAVLYLASDAASWVTGQTLSVSGGFTMV
jgi:2-hydroxycyclohexanecarboxyl-CoA dehydrogenase